MTIQALGWMQDGSGRYLPLEDDIASVAYWYQAEPLRAGGRSHARNPDVDARGMIWPPPSGRPGLYHAGGAVGAWKESVCRFGKHGTQNPPAASDTPSNRTREPVCGFRRITSTSNVAWRSTRSSQRPRSPQPPPSKRRQSCLVSVVSLSRSAAEPHKRQSREHRAASRRRARKP